MHPKMIDAIIAVLKHDVAGFYTKCPAIEVRNPHLELVTALSKRGFPPVPELMDRIEFEAALLAMELEGQGRTAIRSTVHTTNKHDPGIMSA
jgi:hypothetical protein